MPSTSTAPSLGVSSPPARLSSVDLPEPLGPITATSSPGATVRLTWCSACTAVSPVPWRRLTSRSSSTLMRGLLDDLRLRERGDPRLAVVQPADLGLGLEDHRLQHEQPGGIAQRVGLGLEAGVGLQAAQR